MSHRVNTRAIGASVVLTTLLLAAGLSGCGKTETSASMVADAKQFQQKGDNKAALIQYKNAAADSPEDGEVRFQLAALYNQLGDPVSAEKEIRKAISLGIDSARAAPELARAQLMQGQVQKALDDSAAAAVKGGPELLAIRGDAFLSLNQPDKARASFQQALAAKPGSAEGLMGMARLAMADKDVAGASGLIEQAISANPKDPGPWVFKASLLRAQYKPAEAIEAYGQAIALKPDHVNARIERATLEIGAGKFDAAKADIDAARKTAPSGVIVLYSQALLDFSQGRHAAAHESLLKVLNRAPDHLPAILLSAAVEMNLGMLEQAQQHLKKYLEKYPDNVYAHKLLAQTLLKGAQPGEAVATLAPLMKDGAKDAQLLALAGESSMQTRDFNKAAQYFEQASGLAPNTAVLHTSLGQARLGQGDAEKAISELERATALDPKSTQAGAALIRTELALKHYDKALSAAKALVAAQPDNPDVHNLLGGVYLGKGDRAGARAAFEKAGALKPGYYAAVANLAQMDIADKRPDAARQRLLAFAEKAPKNADAVSMLAGLALSQNKPDEATALLEKFTADNPEAVAPATQLAMLYMRNNQQAKAVTLARKLQTANPANPDLLELLGQAQLANNDAAAALETYSMLAKVQPKSPQAQMRLAAVHTLLKNDNLASADLKRAIDLDPHFLPARVAMAEIAARKGNFDQAVAIARDVQKQDGKSAAGYLMEAQLQLANKKPALALPAYEQAFALARDPRILVQLAALMHSLGKDAGPRLQQWQKENPADPFIPTYIAERYLADKQYKLAAEKFEAVLKLAPDNPATLNNLAIAYQQGKDARALPTAERALRLADGSPAVLDTAGWILLEQGNTARALPLLKKAVALAPAAPELRYHLAAALLKSGDKAGARKELDQALAGGKEFAAVADARALLKLL